ncbi:NfeD family protein (plasmid) [Escherichia coli]|uniref:NfeD family protein n=1 Tax=Escherichia coli TaxID=562 RepID=UPI002D785B30|nr:NfeD family protein [Escherichia coli]WRU80002.1 NfeD family protein [Escherichia coli]
MSVGSTHHLEMVFVWKQNYILVDEYFFFCCTWIVNSAGKEFTLSDDIVNGKGQLLIGDTFWPVETLHDENYPAGTRVIVTDMQGITLKVMTIEDKSENKE